MTELPEILKEEVIRDRYIDFRNALFELDPEILTESNIDYIIKIYDFSKLEEIRHQCLLLLYDKRFDDLKDFFERSVKRERKLTVKICSIRGLAQFKSEEGLAPIIEKAANQLRKVMVHTPFDYTTLQTLKGENALPYLANRYGYECIINFQKEVDAFYEGLPPEFKNHFHVDKTGKTIPTNPERSRKRMANFFKKWKG